MPLYHNKYYQSETSFTLIELLVVMVILMIIISVVMVVTSSVRQDAKIKKTAQELHALAIAVEMYYDDYNDYPPEVDQEIPPGVEAYLASGKMPPGSWDDTCYDWDNWTDPATGAKIYQMSLRFCCSYDKPGQGSGKGSCRPPISGFDRFSAIYYCIQGACRSHIEKPITHPGICVNCGGVL